MGQRIQIQNQADRRKKMSIEPKGKQIEVMALPPRGHIVILGTAGSGKTTIALLRAEYLSKLDKSNMILLVTFNKALINYMHTILSPLPKNLVIENYHKFARGYLSSRNKLPRGSKILNDKGRITLIEASVQALKNYYPNESTFNRSIQFFVDEIVFIEKFGFKDLQSYEVGERVGRSNANLARKNRKWVYMVYEKYITMRKEHGILYDWDDLAFHVYHELEGDTAPRRYTHIVIDEGQDFSPMMIRSLVAAVNPIGSFTFFGDVSQQIYGSRLSWRDSGIKTNKVWSFDVNYRNSGVITDFAKDITKNQYWRQSDDMIEALPAVAEGPKPLLIKFRHKNSEFSWIVNQAIALGESASVAILSRTRSVLETLNKKLKRKATIIDRDTYNISYDNGIFLTTYHAAKGLEFDYVFLPNLEDNVLPDPKFLENALDKDEAYADELKLLYVGITRSKYGLYMTYANTLSPLFPHNSSNVDHRKEADLT